MASLTTTSTSDKAEMKQSMRNEAEAMNNMEGKDEKGDIRVTTMAAAMTCLNGMIPADGGEGRGSGRARGRRASPAAGQLWVPGQR